MYIQTQTEQMKHNAEVEIQGIREAYLQELQDIEQRIRLRRNELNELDEKIFEMLQHVTEELRELEDPQAPLPMQQALIGA